MDLSSDDLQIRAALKDLNSSLDDIQRQKNLRILSKRLRKRFLKSGTESDLEDSIRFQREAVELTDVENPLERAKALNALGGLLGSRYQFITGDDADLNESITVTRDAINVAPGGYSGLLVCLNNLAIALWDRYLKHENMKDLKDNIVTLQMAAKMVPINTPQYALTYDNLGCRLEDSYLKTGDISDLEQSIDALDESLKATHLRDEEWMKRMKILGIRVHEHYLKSRDHHSLSRSIDLGRQIVNSVEDENPDRATLLLSLAGRLENLYLQTQVKSDLDEAIQVRRKAVSIITDSHPERIQSLSSLADDLNSRYSTTHQYSDLREFIQINRDLIRIAPRDHPEYLQFFGALVNGLHDEFIQTTSIKHLNEAIQIARQGATLACDTDLYANFVVEIARLLELRFVETGTIDDLQEGIRFSRQIINTITPGDECFILAASTFSALLYRRFLRLKQLRDLVEAVEIQRYGITLMSADEENRGWHLSLLAFFLAELFEESPQKDVADIDEAIQIGRKAADETPAEHATRGEILWTLMNNIVKRYEVAGDTKDLVKAMEVSQEVMKEPIEEHYGPKSTQVFNDIGTLHIRLFSAVEDFSILEAGMARFKSVIELSQSPAQKLIAFRRFLPWCTLTSKWNEAYELSKITIDAMTKISTRAVDISDKQHTLGLISGFGCEAAATVLNANQQPHEALIYLEQGRGMFATYLEGNRTDAVELKASFPELFEKFMSIQKALDEPIEPELSTMTISASMSRKTDQRYIHIEKFNDIVSEIRKQPGFERFLQAPDEAEMRYAAALGPIVVINVCQYRCDAILVQEHQVQHVPLPITMDEIHKQAKSGSLATSNVLEWLWTSIANPVLTALGFTQTPTDDWPHLWWIPTGPLSRFPLHAAGYHAIGSTETVMDRVVSSYSTSINSIIRSRQRAGTGSSSKHALVIVVEQTPGYATLQYAAEEAALVSSLCDSMSLIPLKLQTDAEDIMESLHQCKIFHFAGHGYTDSLDPSKSHLVLGGNSKNTLTVGHLLQTNIRKSSPFFAYLSACGTGELQFKKLIDEDFHLINGYQLAGFRHVIGTLWEVNDKTCVDMARITYEGIKAGDMTDESVAMGLHNAIRDQRDRWIKSYGGSGYRSARIAGAKEARDVNATIERPTTREALVTEGHLIRNLELIDDSEGSASMPWVPYVHFGV